MLATPLPQDNDNIQVEREFDTWSDAGYWAAVVLLPLLVFGFQRGLLTMIVLVILPAPPASAGLWEDLWQRRDQQAHKALIEGEPERAVSLFKDPDWRAAAKYRAQDYAGAALAYAAGRDTTESYNLGNALARLGEYQRAIDAYDRTLALLPDHEDAIFNKALVEKLLEQQEQADDQDNQEQQNQGGEDAENQRQQNPDPGDPGESSDDEQSQSQQEQQQSESEADQSESSESQQPMEGEEEIANRDEKQDALEQWLRRVPDDPGGLLRRKFQYETNQRLRQGNYRDRQTEKTW